MLRVVYKNPWVQALAIIAGVLVLSVLMYLLSAVLVPLVIAFFAAYIANPVVDYFEKRRIPRGITISVMAVTAILAALALPVFFIPHLVNEAQELIKGEDVIPAQAASALAAKDGGFVGTVNDFVDRLPLDNLVRSLGLVAPDARDIDARAVIVDAMRNYIHNNAIYILRQFVAATQAAGLAAAQVFTRAWNTVVAFLSFFGNFALFAFVAGYLLRDFHKMTESIRELIPIHYRDRVIYLAKQIDGQLRGFLRGQLLVMVALGVMYAIGLTLSGTPFGIIIGLLGGLASFVPYLGLILTIIPAAVLTVLSHTVDWHIHVIAVLGTFTVAQVIEGTVLTPRIVGDQIGLNPVWVILAIMVFAGIFGFAGLLIAVPVAAVLKVLVLEAVEAYKRSALFEGDEDEDEDGSSSAVGS